MSQVITFINGLVSQALTLLLRPLQSFNPLIGLLVVSGLFGVLVLLVYGRISWQDKIKSVKREIGAALLEAVLFRHDLALSLRAQGKLLRLAGYYFCLAFPPLVVLGVPCVILLAHLNTYYGYRPLAPGESVLVTARVTSERAVNSLTLASKGALKMVGPVRAPADRTITWRVDVGGEQPGTSGELLLTSTSGETVLSSLPVGESASPIESRIGRNWLSALLYPSPRAKLLPIGVEEFKIEYPERSYRWLGLHWHWMVLFFVVSMVAALAASRVFCVEI